MADRPDRPADQTDTPRPKTSRRRRSRRRPPLDDASITERLARVRSLWLDIPLADRIAGLPHDLPEVSGSPDPRMLRGLPNGGRLLPCPSVDRPPADKASSD